MKMFTSVSDDVRFVNRGKAGQEIYSLIRKILKRSLDLDYSHTIKFRELLKSFLLKSLQEEMN